MGEIRSAEEMLISEPCGKPGCAAAPTNIWRVYQNGWMKNRYPMRFYALCDRHSSEYFGSEQTIWVQRGSAQQIKGELTEMGAWR